MRYGIRAEIVDKGEYVATFPTRASALDAAFLFFSGVDFESRYSNITFLENDLKRRNVERSAISSKSKTWHIEIWKIR